MTKQKKTQKQLSPSTGKIIVVNKKAKHDYFIEERFEVGLVLQGWEVKSLRLGKTQLVDSYIIIKNSELWLLGAHITPLPTVSTHVNPESQRTRKLLMQKREINRLIGFVEQKGYSLVPLSLYWSKGKAKAEIALVRGKKEHDKRQTLKEREWQRHKHRILKIGNRS